MSLRVVILASAEADVTDAAIWHQGQRSGLGEEFIAEVEAVIQSAAANPRQCPLFRRTPEVRRALTKRFPYRVFFIVRSDAVIVFRVLHGARHDREWKAGIPEI
jgi:plasmid stabilization system protein ParE